MQRRWWVVVAAVAATLPTLVWTVHGVDFISDDYGVCETVRTDGIARATWDFAVNAPARPLAGAYYGTTCGVLGQHPVLYSLLLAALNLAVVLLVAKLALRLLPERLAILATLMWAVLPNRGSLRLWLVLGPDVLALALLVGGALLLLSDRRRSAAIVLALGVLGYEAVLVPAVLAVAVWVVRERLRWRDGALVVAPTMAAALFIFIRSPKRIGAPPPFSHTGNLIPAHFGIGVFGVSWAATIGSIVLAGLATAVAVRFAFPSFRHLRGDRDRLFVAGLVLLVAGALPFMYAAFPFATEGIFDRGNAASDLGTALVYACALDWLFALRLRPRMALALAALPITWFAALNAVDVRDYRRAVDDGHRLLAQIDQDLPHVPAGGVYVTPPLPNRGGVKMLILGGDLVAALEMKRGPTEPIRMALDDEAGPRPDEQWIYDWTKRTLIRRP